MNALFVRPVQYLYSDSTIQRFPHSPLSCSKFDVQSALLKSFLSNRSPLSAECVGQHSDGCFGDHLFGTAGIQSRTHRAFEPTEVTFDRPTPPELGFAQVAIGHLGSPRATFSPIRS